MGDSLIHPIQRWPERGPLDLIPVISSYISGKTVCDIGCGAGDLLYEIRRLGLSDDIIGIENDEWMFRTIGESGSKDRDFILMEDLYDLEIPKADVYLLWVPIRLYGDIIDRIPSSIVIDCIENSKDHKELMSKLTFIEEITYEYDEEPYSKKGKLKNTYRNRGDLWLLKGERTITVYKKKKD